MSAVASVIVRCKDEAPVIERALRSLREQTVETEIVLVDSGSTDGSVDLARPHCDQVIRLSPEEFSFGGALNVGAAQASAAVLFALSAHCVAADPLWVETALEHYADERVAATCGLVMEPNGEWMQRPRPVTFDDVRADPHYWGLSNHASSWRRSTWEQHPFDATLTACEDKEWMWRVMLAGWTVVADPRLVVASDHRRAAGLRSLWAREVAEHAAIAAMLDFPIPSTAQVATAWWGRFPWPSPRPRWQRRFSPWRTTELLAGYVGDRVGAARRDSHTVRLPDGPLVPRPAAVEERP